MAIELSPRCKETPFEGSNIAKFSLRGEEGEASFSPNPSPASSLHRHCCSTYTYTPIDTLYTPWLPTQSSHTLSFPATFVNFHPPKTEYEIETKETMQEEQKVIVLTTMSYCNVLCEDKRLLN